MRHCKTHLVGLAACLIFMVGPIAAAENLDQVDLRLLRFVGVLDSGERMLALVRTPDSLVHRVARGNTIGNLDGRVTAITRDVLFVTESGQELQMPRASIATQAKEDSPRY